MINEEKQRERYLGKIELLLRLIQYENKRKKYTGIPHITTEDLIKSSGFTAEEIYDLKAVCHMLDHEQIGWELYLNTDADLKKEHSKAIGFAEGFGSGFCIIVARKGLCTALAEELQDIKLQHPEYDTQMLADLLINYVSMFTERMTRVLDTYGYPYDMLANTFWFGSDVISEKEFRKMGEALENQIAEWRANNN